VENQLEIAEEIRPQPIVTETPSSKFQSITLFSSLALALISIIGVVLLYLSNSDIQDINGKQQTTIDSQKAEIAALTVSNASLTASAALITGIDEKAKSLAKAMFLLYVEHDVEGGIVTDDFTVEKLRLDVVNDKLAVTIDVNNQPQMAAHYKGSGGYDLTDRELRAKSTEIIAQVKARYNSSFSEGLPVWDDANVYLTVKNYAIGNSTSGEFSLVGEK
jgi:hypothetical protein